MVELAQAQLNAWAKTYTNKSNARRAAVKAGLDPNTAVFAKAGAYIVKQPSAVKGRDPDAALTKAVTDVIGYPPVNAPKAIRKTSAAEKKPRTDKTALVISMLNGNGATVDELTKATDWLPHTLRARLAGLGKPPHSLKIARERKDGVTSYRIAS